MDKLWSTEGLLVYDKRGLLFWHHRLNHLSLKSLLGLSKRKIIPRNLSDIKKNPPCVSFIFGKFHKRT